ncbi:MAG TPA: hypothetical protein VM450_00895 [Thermomicrobiales bacterium]|nr:hypothetical protein [Thermomicrobiales bacterium]
MVGCLSLLVLVLCVFPAGPATASSSRLLQASSPEQQLAERYAPVAEVRQQEKPCDRSGEGYFPAPVDVVLGNPEVVLKQVNEDGDDRVVKQGPTAQDLAGKDDTYYLDFPGNPNEPGCTYETDFKRFAEARGAQPTTYARVHIDYAHTKLVLQYWFWYYFNDWNNTHESDWEMVQLVFDTVSAEDALRQDPAEIGYAQHGGGEIATWGEDKLEIDGQRLIVYPAAGSHGTYFNNNLFIGWGENGTGFGCDNTTTPSRYVPLNVAMLPENPTPTGEFAWLLYQGKWGEIRHPPYAGPQGPNAGTKWLNPVNAMDDWRDTSLSVPASRTLGPNATDLFCGLSTAVSRLATQLWPYPYRLVITFLAIIAAIGVLFMSRRDELREAFGLYRAHLRTFLLIGAATLPIGIAFNGFALIAQQYPPMDWIVQWFNDTDGAHLTAAAIVGGIQQIAMFLLISPPIIIAMREIQAGRRPGIVESFVVSYRHLVVLVLALAIVFFAVLLLAILVIGIPVAIWIWVRWQFFGQAVLLGDATTAPEAVRKSGHAVTGRWWQVVGDSLVFQMFSLVPGPLVGVLLLLIGGAAVDFANTFSSIVYAITIPITIIGLTQAYQRYRARARKPAPHAEVEPASTATTLQPGS